MRVAQLHLHLHLHLQHSHPKSNESEQLFLHNLVPNFSNTTKLRNKMLGRSSFRSGSLRPENLGQNALAMIASLCFSAFVIGVFLFTLISFTYNPQYPKKFTNFLSPESDSGVLTDDTASSPFINVSDVESAVMEAGFAEISDAHDCRVDEPINCRDLEVFHLLMGAAIDKFKDIHFYRFGKPVEGENSSCCHMAWRFKPKEGKASGFNKDYRSFRVVRYENCTLSVVGIGEYHSGGNARKRKGKGKEKEKEKVPLMAVETLDAGEAVSDDGILMAESKRSFSEGKYLVYVGGGDRCKDLGQYLWGFTCMLGEAEFLNRTLVMDLSLCLSKIYSSSGVDEEGKDFRLYFDFEHLKDSSSVLDQAQFWSDWNERQNRDELKLHLVEDFRVTPMKLAEVKDSLIMRKFGNVEPDNFWCRVCEGDAEAVIERPWHKVLKARRLLDIASGIASRLNWDYDAVRVERGEKAKDKNRWPNLDRDTSPQSLVAALKGKIEDGRKVYIAADEANTSFFDPLKDKYSIHLLDEFKDLWDGKSDWYYETTKLNNGNAVEFDGYMRLSVDSEVFYRGKKKIETFNDLTKDCKDGLNTC